MSEEFLIWESFSYLIRNSRLKKWSKKVIIPPTYAYSERNPSGIPVKLVRPNFVSLPLGPFKAETNQGVIQNAIPVVFYSQHFLACPGLHHNTSGKNVLSSWQSTHGWNFNGMGVFKFVSLSALEFFKLVTYICVFQLHIGTQKTWKRQVKCGRENSESVGSLICIQLHMKFICTKS